MDGVFIIMPLLCVSFITLCFRDCFCGCTSIVQGAYIFVHILPLLYIVNCLFYLLSTVSFVYCPLSLLYIVYVVYCLLSIVPCCLRSCLLTSTSHWRGFTGKYPQRAVLQGCATRAAQPASQRHACTMPHTSTLMSTNRCVEKSTSWKVSVTCYNTWHRVLSWSTTCLPNTCLPPNPPTKPPSSTPRTGCAIQPPQQLPPRSDRSAA